MIENISWFWIVAGLAAGTLHASMLWRHVRQPSVWAPLLGLLRMGVVAAVLVISAISGTILETSAGWTIGFLLLASWLIFHGFHRVVESEASSHVEGN